MKRTRTDVTSVADAFRVEDDDSDEEEKAQHPMMKTSRNFGNKTQSASGPNTFDRCRKWRKMRNVKADFDETDPDGGEAYVGRAGSASEILGSRMGDTASARVGDTASEAQPQSVANNSYNNIRTEVKSVDRESHNPKASLPPEVAKTEKFICWVCRRKFGTLAEKEKHDEVSELHKMNLLKSQQKK